MIAPRNAVFLERCVTPILSLVRARREDARTSEKLNAYIGISSQNFNLI